MMRTHLLFAGIYHEANGGSGDFKAGGTLDECVEKAARMAGDDDPPDWFEIFDLAQLRCIRQGFVRYDKSPLTGEPPTRRLEWTDE